MRVEIYNASAGSGKTYMLVGNYLCNVVWKPKLYRHILAVTFTNKATEEMKSRILRELHKLASGKSSDYLGMLAENLDLRESEIRRNARLAQTEILHDYSRFTVLTIDKFFQRILHAFVKELGIDLNYNVEIESAPILTRSVDALIERITEDRELKQWIEAYAAERIEENEGWDLRRDILRLGGELFKEGNRAALRNAPKREELAQIVRTASEQMKRSQKEFRDMGRRAVAIVEATGLTLEDFSHGYSSGAAWFFDVANGETSAPGKRARKCGEAVKGWFTQARARQYQGFAERLQPVMKELCDFYDSHVAEWNTTILLKEHYRSFALLANLYELVQALWREENSLLLSETKNILAAFIDHNEVPFIYEKAGTRFDRYMIDEFQDTSRREWLNFLPLLRDAVSHPTQLSAGDDDVEQRQPAVLLVGDVKQSIYRWRGGDWRILGSDAAQAMGGAQVKSMTQNYRSMPGIVRFNNDAIQAVVSSADAKLGELLGGAAPALSRELAGTLKDAYRDHTQTPRRKCQGEGYISVETFTERRPPIVERILEILDRGYAPCDIMILVHTAADGAKAAEALLNFKQNNREQSYRFDVMTQDALLISSSPLCGFLRALLRLTIDPEDTIHRAVCNRFWGREFDEPLHPDEILWLQGLKLLPPEEAFEQIVMRYNLNNRTSNEHDGEQDNEQGSDKDNEKGCEQDRSQIAYLQALHDEIIGFSAGRVADIPLFLSWWDEHGEDRSISVEKSRNTIEITTIHKAKGLENKVVLLPYCNWSLEPKISGEASGIIWAEAEGELGRAGCVPVKYGRNMAESFFSDAYYRELVYSYVDNVNLLYVALTRAAEQLHIFIPASRSQIGGYLWSNIIKEGDRAIIGSTVGRFVTTPTGERCEFGQFGGPEPASKKRGQNEREVDHLQLKDYPTFKPLPGLKLPTANYLERGGEAEFSPRNFGILMHRLFEQAADLKELHAAVGRMREEGLLSPADSDRLRKMVERALEAAEPRSWFTEQWDRVLCERDIILNEHKDSEGLKSRPDRVMIRGQRAVVVDYKFGKKDPAAYRKQVSHYVALLRKMGYTEVEGWLWYVKLGSTERVE